MSKQEYGSFQLPATKAEIIALFEKYNFRDQHGHPLHLCSEFIELVNFYCGTAQLPDHK